VARRLALLADDSHEAPWTRASGDESAVRVKGTGVGDKLWMEVIHHSGERTLLTIAEGTARLLFPSPMLKYRVGKVCGGSRCLTTVEVLLGSY